MGMLAENLKQWVAEHKEYKEAALAEGFAKGYAEAFEKGYAEAFEKGYAEGLEEGKRELLLRLIEKKYGTDVHEQLTDTLRQQTTVEALDQFGDWIIECGSAEELFQHFRASSNDIS